MRRAAPFALIAFGLSAALLVAQNLPTGVVEGTVVNSVTGAGIGGAAVVLVPVEPTTRRNPQYETTADAAGHFKIAGIAPGSYRPDAKKDGYSSSLPDLRLLTNLTLRVAADTDPVKVEIKLTAFNSIRGRVLDPDGKPAANIEVSLYPNILANEVVTGAEGLFAFEGIRPGSYRLVAKPSKSAPAERASDGTRTAMVNTYYPSVADLALSQQIVFEGQGDLSGYEIRMQTALVHRVSGIVLDEGGKPSPRAEVTLLRNYEGSPGPMGMLMRSGFSQFAIGLRRGPTDLVEATVIAGEDGRFEFPAVRSGDWRINAESDPSREERASRGTASAQVGRSDIDDLKVQVAKPFKLTGTVEWKDAQIAPGLMTLINPDGDEFVANGIVESGQLLFENVLPGRYTLIIKPGLSAQIFLGQSEVTGQTFTVSADGPRLRVVLKTWSGTVRGMVEKGEGATVVLIPQRTDGAAIGQTAVCRAGGSFELSEVSPGDYYIAAFDHMDGMAPSAAMIGLMPSRGTSVKVEERSSTDVKLSVIAMPR